MIEETVIVSKTDSAGNAWVKTERQSTCSGCSASNMCGTSLLAGFFAKRQKDIRVENTLNASEGDRVVVGIQESSLIHSALGVYLLPLLVAFIFAVIAGLLFANNSSAIQELASIISAIAGFLITMLAVRNYFKHKMISKPINPVMLRKIITPVVGKVSQEVL